VQHDGGALVFDIAEADSPAVAGAGVEGHIHLHVVPRWAGDNNYMPVLADTRVMPQSLEESYDALEGGFV
jgi:diadenosine tetraphosphate (Ap4A) HIT family hydrolase